MSPLLVVRCLSWVPAYLIVCLMSGLSSERTVQLMLIPFIMALPFAGLCYLLPRRRMLLWNLYAVWSFCWFAEVLAELFLVARYGLVPQSQEVMVALVNAPIDEAREFADTLLWPLLLSLLAGVLVAVYFSGNANAFFGALRWSEKRSGPRAILAVAMVILPLVAHGNSVVERADPITFWHAIASEGREMMREQQTLLESRKAIRTRLAFWQPVYRGHGKKTLVMMIGESSNRWDWSLYGYSRATTPRLDALRRQLLVFKDVVSSCGNTICELNRALTPADHDDDDKWQREPSVIGLAKAAGYRIFWITNQSATAINAAYGHEADQFRLVYVGRASRHDRSLDERVLPELDKALADPSPLKLIVLHTLGSHQNYAERYPREFDRFGRQEDRVSRGMASRWWWVRKARAHYDNSILYTDDLIARVLTRLKGGTEEKGFLYFSDHAQDVGHLTGGYGHQFQLESGFTVPLIYWSNRPGFPDERERSLESRPYQTDQLDWTILGLLSVQTRLDRPEFDLFGNAYKPWQRVIAARDYHPGISHRPKEQPEAVGQ